MNYPEKANEISPMGLEKYEWGGKGGFNTG